MKRIPSILTAAAGLLAVLGMAAPAWLLHKNFTEWQRSETEIRRIQSSIRSSEAVYSLVLAAESAARAYMLTGRQEDLSPYDMALDDLGREVMALKRIVKGRQPQTEMTENLAGLVRERRASMNDAVISRRAGGFDSARLLTLTSRGTGLTLEIDKAVSALQDEERRGLAAWELQARAGSVQRVWLLAALFLFAFLAMTVSLAAVIRSSRRRRQAEAELARVRAELKRLLEQPPD